MPRYLRCQKRKSLSCSLSLLLVEAKLEKTSIQHKALPNAEVNVLPHDDDVNVVSVVVVVCFFVAQ